MAGTLFVVATPIGNLEDLTFRALRVLKSVDVIAAEDTRRTARLLAHYEIRRRLVSLHEHNEHREAPRLVDRLRQGESIALVSDAGTPAISDPGTTLVRLCREASLPVVAVPGPSAVTAALSVTGVPAVPFTFMGFPPARGRERDQWFEDAADAPGVVVLFEAPHRLARTLEELGSMVYRPIFVHREISKVHEELVIWNNREAIQSSAVEERGEIVVVLGRMEGVPALEFSGAQLLSMMQHLERLPWLAEEQRVRAVAAALGMDERKVRSTVKKERILVKRQNDAEP